MKNKIYLSILLILSIFFSSIIWKFININFQNIQIYGEYFENKHHALNDPLRYIFFISLPITVYLFCKFFLNKKRIDLNNLKFENVKNKIITNDLFVLNLILIIFLFLEFFSIEFPVNKIDIYHEGQKLSAPFKSLIDEKLWSGSFVTTGIINENLGVKFIWKILDHQSIGSMRYLQLLYILLFKLLLLILIYFISNNILSNQNLKLVFYLVSAILTLYLIDYDVGSADVFSYRDLPVLLCLIFFFKNFDNQKNINLSLILISLLSILSFFWSIDRAINVNLLIMFICLYLLLNKNYKNVISIIVFIIIFWLISYLYLGDEFKFFISNTISVLKNQNYIHGIIHPQPFSDMPNSTRATKSLLLIILSLLISLSFFFHKKIRYSNRLKIILITLSFVSFCSYLYALGRSDGVHIKQTTGILILFFSTFVFYNLIKISEKFFKKFFLLLVIFSLTIIFIFNLKINFENIHNYSNRFNEFVFLKDKEYLSEDQNYLVENIKPLLDNYNCVQLFTYDAALPYLFKKPSCTKYYFIYSLGSVDDQIDLINNMNNTSLIIYSGETDYWGISPKKKLPLVDSYINANFQEVTKILKWDIKFK